MISGIISQVGASIALTKEISEADVALFALIMQDQLPSAEEPRATDPAEKSRIPDALVAALLAAVAARHAGGLADVGMCSSEVRCMALAYAGDTLTATAEVAAYDSAGHIVRIRAQCVNQQGTRLAEGTFELRAAL